MTASRRGRLLALEGIDGCGKSTQAALLAERLGALLTHEPGATAFGRRLRALLLDAPDGHTPDIDIRAEALVMLADRAQHLAEVVEPALAAGRTVVTDRFAGSTLAYQGYGRQRTDDLDQLAEMSRWASGGVAPDLNILVAVPVDRALARRADAGRAADRLESQGQAFQVRVAEGFAALARQDPEAWAVVDGTGSVDEVAAAVWSAVEDRLGHV